MRDSIECVESAIDTDLNTPRVGVFRNGELVEEVVGANAYITAQVKADMRGRANRHSKYTIRYIAKR